jgi:triacylglycerol lipase
MHAATWAILIAGLLLVSIALLVLAQRTRRQRAKARSALPEREPEAAALLPPPAKPAKSPPAPAEERPPAAEPLPGADAAPGPAPCETTADADASPTTDTGAAALLLLPAERPLLWVRREARGQTRHPIVLAHGFSGFDELHFFGRRFAYFRGVAEHLRSVGAEVYVLRVSPVASIAVRAQQLAEQLQRLPAERVNIVAHSMGGLDARYAIAGLGVAQKIASLTTIGTPHRGTPLADLGVSLLSRGGAIERLGLSLDAFHDLTTTRMEAFNREIEDAPGVEYGCFVAAARRGVTQVNALLVPAYLFLQRRAGENDGVVPAVSQRWGKIWGEIDVDHWGAVGWSSVFDASMFYQRVVTDLRDRGL